MKNLSAIILHLFLFTAFECGASFNVSEKDFSSFDLSDYGVVGVLDKNKMKPEEVVEYARRYS